MTHDPKIMRRSGRVYGAAYLFVCTCGTRTPLMSKPAAEKARDAHVWEHHLDDQETA